MNFAGAVIDEDDESEWQIIHDWLSDCSGDRHELAFSVFADVPGGHRKRAHFWTTPVYFDVGHIDEHEQSGQNRIGESPGHAHLLSRRKTEIVGNADIDAASAILDRKALIKRARAERAGRNRDRAINGHDGPQRQTAR